MSRGRKIQLSRLPKVTLGLAFVSLWLLACDDSASYIRGAITTQYDMTFGSVTATQVDDSGYLVIEYHRPDDSGEKPLIINLHPTPTGPGRYSLDDGTSSITIENALTTALPLPPTVSATIDLETFHPGAEGSVVQGTIDARLETESGDELTLEAGFKTSLHIISG